MLGRFATLLTLASGRTDWRSPTWAAARGNGATAMHLSGSLVYGSIKALPASDTRSTPPSPWISPRAPPGERREKSPFAVQERTAPVVDAGSGVLSHARES